MSTRNLPERASLAYLKKLAKERLAARRTTDPAAKLADTQLAIAREYGFSSWRELKAEIDRRRAPTVAEFLRACTEGDVGALRELLKNDPGLVDERIAAGSTGLHQAVRHPDALRLLIEHGADPNVRDDGDNASALHLAAAHGNLESVRILLAAGADVHGTGDLHKGDVIGWASREGNEAVIDLLLACRSRSSSWVAGFDLFAPRSHRRMLECGRDVIASHAEDRRCARCPARPQDAPAGAVLGVLLQPARWRGH